MRIDDLNVITVVDEEEKRHMSDLTLCCHWLGRGSAGMYDTVSDVD